MSYLVADKLGPETAGGTRAPAPYTTNRLEDGKVVHYLKGNCSPGVCISLKSP